MTPRTPIALRTPWLNAISIPSPLLVPLDGNIGRPSAVRCTGVDVGRGVDVLVAVAVEVGVGVDVGIVVGVLVAVELGTGVDVGVLVGAAVWVRL